MVTQTRTPEQIERGGQLIDALWALFMPYVEAVCRPKIEAEMAKPMEFSEEAIKNAEEAVKENPEMLPPDVQDELRQFVGMMRDPKPFTPEEIEAAVKEESGNECAQLVRNWLNTFYLLETDDEPNRSVDGKLLDDAMLLPLTGEDAECFERSCAQGLLDLAETRAVLRQVRLALTPGKILPDEAVEYLRIENFTFLP